LKFFTEGTALWFGSLYDDVYVCSHHKATWNATRKRVSNRLSRIKKV